MLYIDQHLEPQTTRKKLMFPQTTISYVKDFNCHIGTTICFWLFGVPGSAGWKKIGMKSTTCRTESLSKNRSAQSPQSRLRTAAWFVGRSPVVRLPTSM